MTYYEELGLRRDAPVQDIHQAYRVLARLVHPDGQANQQVRDMAERQMKRLNDILATLTDSERRREYDESLLAQDGAGASAQAAGASGPVAAESAPQTARRRPSPAAYHASQEPLRTRLPAWAGVALGNWFWVVLLAMILGVGCWYIAADRSAPAAEAKPKPLSLDELPPVAPPEAEAQTPLPAPAEAAAPRKDTAKPAAPKPATGVAAKTPPAPAQAAAAKESGRGPAEAASQVPSAASPVAANAEPSNAPGVPRAAVPSFAGNWLYAPAVGDAPTPGSYPAIYVEFLLTEERGELSGSYRAKYRIPDQAVSPEVLFRVQGKASTGEAVKLGWVAADGAKGEVEMTLHGPNAMSVTWWTTEFGRHASLASGTAKLLRQRTQ